LIFSIPTVEMLQKEIKSLYNFSFLKIIKIEPANNRNGMNQSFPCTYGPIYHGTIFFFFLEKYLKKFFVLPGLPSNEKNSSDHHNSYNKGPNPRDHGVSTPSILYTYPTSPCLNLKKDLYNAIIQKVKLN
jgi:hypothetical protein